MAAAVGSTVVGVTARMQRYESVVAVGTALTDAIAAVARRSACRSAPPVEAFEELRLCSNGFGPDCHTEAGWFRHMSSRYDAARAMWLKTSAATDAEGEVRSALQMSGLSAQGDGAKMDHFVASLATSANGMLSDSVPSGLLRAHLTALDASSGKSTIPLGDAVSFFIRGPVFDQTMTTGWWFDDVPRQVTCRKVALRAVPPTLLVAFSAPSTGASENKTVIRHRTFDLNGHLRETGSVIPLSRKLAKHCSPLGIEESDLLKLLTKLQKLVKEALEAIDEDDTSDVAAGSGSHGDADSRGPTSSAAPAAGSSNSKSTAAQKADLGLLYRDPEAALKNVDLQSADDVVVKEFKDKMNEKFESNAIKPGDPGYKYDLRKEFKPTAKSEWDESDED